MTPVQQQEFLEKLSKKQREKYFDTAAIVYLNRADMEPHRLFDLLMINESLLNEDGKQAIDYLESMQEEKDQIFSYRNFKWKIMAFLAIQDMLTIPLFGENAVDKLLKIKYFYYESKYILSEIIVASLNGLHIGNRQLLRNFMEFNLQQCYFINKIHKEQSYQSFDQYLKNRIPPSQGKLINTALPDDTFCKPIRKRISLEFDHLSNRYSHAHSLYHSPKLDGIFQPGFTIESLYFYIQISITLDAILWTYYVNYPMLFRPVDIIKKFGFSPPPLFTTEDVTWVIEQAMTPDDFNIFKDYAMQSEVANGHIDWYNSLPDLSEEEAWASSDHPREEGEPLQVAYLKMTTMVRAYSEMIYETKEEQSARRDEMDKFDVNSAEYLVQLSRWRQVYKKL